MQYDAQWVATATGGRLVGPNNRIVGSVETDSRECGPGSLYVARRGENTDGHRFIASAYNSGAVAAIVETPIASTEAGDDNRRAAENISQIVVGDATVALGDLAAAHLRELRTAGQIRVVGITGSAGKTTTKDLLGQILGSQAPTVFPQLSYNNEVGCPLTILRADCETKFLVLEMGASGVGHLRYLTDIAPLDVAVVLMVGRAHLGGFGSETNLGNAKQELVEGLLPSGVAVLNADDPRVLAMLSVAPGPALLFSANAENPAQLRAESVALDEAGRPQFTAKLGRTALQILPGLVGEHQVSNILAALGAAVALGVDLGEAVESMADSTLLSPHRMDVQRDRSWHGKDQLTVIDDSYNANPDSMGAGLRAARAIAGNGRLVAILGEMLELGPQSQSMHAEVGAHANKAQVDVLVGVGQATAAISKALPAETEIHATEHPDEVISLLPEIIESGDTLFLKGSWGSGVWNVADAVLSVPESTEGPATDC